MVRTDSVDPKSAKSRMLVLSIAPNRQKPTIDIADPTLTIPRIDRDDPIWKKSQTETDDPIRPIDRSEIVEPR